MITFFSIGGPLVRIVLPDDRDELEEAVPIFDRACRQIASEWELRQSYMPKGKRQDSPIAWLELLSYRVIQGMINNDQIDCIFDRLNIDYTNGFRPSGIDVFRHGLSCIFADNPRVISPRDLERIWKRIWHAYRHYVPDAFLRGFLHQYGSRPLREMVEGTLEPECQSWIASQRARVFLDDESGFDELRGSYPLKITALMDERRRRARDNMDWERNDVSNVSNDRNEEFDDDEDQEFDDDECE